MDNGKWVRLYQSTIFEKVFADPNLLKLWVYCLCRMSVFKRSVALTTPNGTHTIELQPGQWIYGRLATAEALGWTPSTVRNRMAKLTSWKLIRMKATRNYSIITVIHAHAEARATEKQDSSQDSGRTTEGHSPQIGRVLEKNARPRDAAGAASRQRRKPGRKGKTGRTQEERDAAERSLYTYFKERFGVLPAASLETLQRFAADRAALKRRHELELRDLDAQADAEGQLPGQPTDSRGTQPETSEG